MLHFKFALRQSTDGTVANTANGTAYIAQSGIPQKQALFNAAGGSLSNPISLSNGVAEFWTAETITAVDAYIQTPDGHFIILKGIKPSGLNELEYENTVREVQMVIPFAIQDTAAATETNTGFNLPTNAVVQPYGAGIEVTTLESGKTIQVGILSSQSGGSASGFINAVSLAAAATVLAAFSNTSGTLNGNTFGAFLASYGAGAPGTGYAFLSQYVCNGTAKTISYTLSSGTAAAQGFILLNYVLPPV